MKLNEQLEMPFESPVKTDIPKHRAVKGHPNAKWWFAYMRRLVAQAPDSLMVGGDVDARRN
ncbi:hypothetical protein N9059_00660 [bacterium]|nr:hypothetical protein [bacterium]